MRTARLTHKGHASFLGSPVTLFYIAAYASCDDIFPSVSALSRSRQHVVESEFVIVAATVLTLVFVAIEYVAARERNLLVRNGNVVAQPDHRRKRKVRINVATVVLDLFGFSFQKKNDGSLPRSDIKRFIRSIKDENFAHRAAREKEPLSLN